ncbi:MAG: DUF3466 family protein [Fimbriimonadaceae bacterium]|jgi:uncharacterized membrane protein|nr:DUF3466 family protein [Fimbriimonadaceae bacterium]
MKFRSLPTTLSVLAAIAAIQVVTATGTYEVVQIGNLAGYETGRATAINSQNIVMGNSFSGTSNRPWIFSEAQGMTSLGFNFGQEFTGTDLNNLNQTSAYAEGWKHGARLIPGQAVGWGNLPGFTETEALGINDSGAMVGGAWNQGTSRGVRFNVDFTYTLLPTLNALEDSRAFRVNNAGVAVGHSGERAVMWFANNSLFDLHSLLPAGTVWSSALDINEAGWITGHFHDSSDDFRGFRFNFETGMTFFDPLVGDSYLNVSGINNHGHVVGLSRRNHSVGLREAFIFDGDSVVSLNSLIAPNSGWVLNEASDINDNGYIVGRGHFQGVETNFLLKPVPEPASLVILGGGLLALVGRRRAKGSRR